MRYDGALTRSGVFSYRRADGSIRREYRPDAEVFAAESLASFASVPVTLDHPSEPVTAANARQYAVGQLDGEPRRDGNHVVATVIVNDAAAIAAIKSGKSQLSNGYEVELDETPGVTPDGERFDATQKMIRGNHVAIVDAARAGKSASLRVDAADMVCDALTCNATGDSVNLEQALAALAIATARADAADAKVKTETDAKIVALEAQLAVAKNAAADATKRADAADKARTDAAEGALASARLRIALEGVAKTVLGEAFKADAADRDLMVAVALKVDGEKIAADASADYVKAMYNGAARRFDAARQAGAGARIALIAPAVATNDDPEAAAAAKLRKDTESAWKGEKDKK